MRWVFRVWFVERRGNKGVKDRMQHVAASTQKVETSIYPDVSHALSKSKTSSLSLNWDRVVDN